MNHKAGMVTSMLVTDVGDKCGDKCVGDKICMLVTSHVTNIESLVPTSNISHQHHILPYYDVGDRCKSLRICLKMAKKILNLAPS